MESKNKKKLKNKSDCLCDVVVVHFLARKSRWRPDEGVERVDRVDHGA